MPKAPPGIMEQHEAVLEDWDLASAVVSSENTLLGDRAKPDKLVNISIRTLMHSPERFLPQRTEEAGAG